MASNQGAEIAWLVMAATCHETFGYGRDRLARLKQNSMNNYKQYLEWEKEDKDLALDRLRRCVQDALKEDLRVADTDDRKGMLSTPAEAPAYTRRPLSTRRYSGGPERRGQWLRSPYTAQQSTTKP